MVPIYNNEQEYEYPSVLNQMTMEDSIDDMRDHVVIRPKAVLVDISIYYARFYKRFKTNIRLDINTQLALDIFIVMVESALPDYPESIWFAEDFTNKSLNFISQRYIAFYNGNIPKATGYNNPGAASDISTLCEIFKDDLNVDKRRDKMFLDPELIKIVYDAIKYIIMQVSLNCNNRDDVLMYSPVGVLGSCLENPMNPNLIGSEYSLQIVVIPISKEW